MVICDLLKSTNLLIESLEAILAGQVLSLAAVVAKEPPVNFVSVVHQAMHQLYRLQLATLIAVKCRLPVILLALCHTSCVCEPCDFFVFLLHFEKLPLTSLTVVNACLELVEI